MHELTLDKLPRALLSKLDLETVFKVSRCVVAAERLQLFRKLDNQSLTATAIGRRVGLHKRFSETFLDILTALGLLFLKDGRYRVSPLARKYFIKERGLHWTRLWSGYCSDDYLALSVLERTLTTGRDYRKILGIKRPDDYEILRYDRKWADDFTHVMHDNKIQECKDLAAKLDLSDCTSLLDVGGGSGIMSMALVRKHPRLKACVLDFEPVCRAARKIIRSEGFSRRVKVLAGDMTKHIPAGYDVVMFWDVGDIPDRTLKLAFRSLPVGGMVLIGGRYLTGRQKRSINGLTRLLSEVYPPLATWQETVAKLKLAGFDRVKRRRIKGSTWLISGYK